MFGVTRAQLFTTSRLLYLTGVALLLVFIVPTPWFPLQEGKLAAFTICMALSAIAYVFSGAIRTQLMGRSSRLLLIPLLVPLTSTLSWFFSVDPVPGLIGYSVDADTVLFSVIAYMALVLGYALFRTERGASLLLNVITFSLIAAALFQFFIVSFGYAVLPFETITDRSANLIGKWNDLGLILGLLTLWLVMHLQWSDHSMRRRGIQIALLGCCVLLLALVQFPTVWMLILISSLFLLGLEYARRRRGASVRATFATVPMLPLALAVTSVFFLFFGSYTNAGLTRLFPVSSVEVRPSALTTLQVVRESQDTPLRMLLGTGPNTFTHAWLEHKTPEVNKTQFWSLDFTVGYSTLFTALSGEGILGLFAWLMLPLLVIVCLLRHLRSSSLLDGEKHHLIFLGSGALYLFFGATLYVFSPTVLLLAFICAGALIGSHHKESEHRGELHISTLLGIVMVVVALLCASIVTTTALISTVRNQALVVLQSNDLYNARAFALRADAIASRSLNNAQRSDAKRLLAQIGLLELTAYSSAPNPTAETLQRFTSTSETVKTDIETAIALNPQDYRAYVLRGDLYALFASLNVVPGAQETAKSAYEAAAKLNPTNPSIPLAQARLEAQSGNIEGVQKFLANSFSIKDNYTDAILFIVQIEIARKNLPGAIEAATAAIRTAPELPGLWFELGLLSYASSDSKNAIPAFEKAIELQPDYANAKYFLGLSYYAEGRSADAVALFAALVKQNPDNAEVRTMLANMRSGLPAMPPQQESVAPPEARAKAPISE